MTTTQYEKLKYILSSELGVAWVLGRQPQHGAKASALISRAVEHSVKAIQCLMLGMQQEGLQLLAKADEWLTIALEHAVTGERISLEFERHFQLSVCRWLIGPPVQSHDLTRGCELLQVSKCMVEADMKGNADELDSVLAMLVYAERYQDCIVKFEREQAKAPGSKRQRYDEARNAYLTGKISADEAAALEEDHIEAPMAYLIARERLIPTLTESELQQRITVFLRQRAPIWAKYARYDLFTMWVRITTQADAGPPARDAVRAIADQFT